MAIVTHPALRQALAVNARKTQDLTTKRVVGAHGTGHLVVRASESCGGDRIIPNAAGVTFGPNAQVLVADPGGGNRSLAVISRPPSGSGSALAPREVAKTVTTTAEPVGAPLLALKVVSFSGGLLKIDIAAFSGATFVQTLHSNVTLTGLEVGVGADSAAQNLLTARSVTGVTGVPDGSILLCVEDGVLFDGTQPTVHLVNITTGAVSSKKFVATEITLPLGIDDSLLDRHHLGMDYFGDEIYVTFFGDATGVGNDFEISQVAKFPPDLASQSILGGQGVESSQVFGVVHFADDSIVKVGTVGNWDRIEYGVGYTSDHVPSTEPQPGQGRDVGNIKTHPRDLGLSGGKHYTIGAATADNSIQVFTVIDLADAVANGWSDIGPPTGECFIQLRNGTRTGGYDWNADRSEILAYPHALSAGTVAGLVRIPITASTWADATAIVMDTASAFGVMDAVIADARGT